MRKIKKITKLIFLFLFLILLFTSILFFSGFFSSSTQASEDLDRFIGVYEGTYNDSTGINGLELMILKNNSTYQTVFYFFPIIGDSPNQRSDIYLGDVRYNKSKDILEVGDSSLLNRFSLFLNRFSWLNKLFDRKDVNLFGRLSGTTFSGVVNNRNELQFSVKRISDSNFTYEGPHGHHGSEENVTIRNATCTNEGVKIIYCVFCGEIAEEEVLPTIPHNLEDNWVVKEEATCTNEGHHVKYCTVCDGEAVSEAIPKLEHTNTIRIKNATCTNEGEKVTYCVFCGEIAQIETLPALPHTPGDNWIVDIEATCTEEGSEIKKCTVCGGETVKQVIPIAPHTYDEDVWEITIEPTCWNDGAQEIKCEKCGEVVKTDTIPKLDHKPTGTFVVVKEALCNEIGRRVQYCIECNEEVISEDIPIINLDHVFKKHVISGGIFSPPIIREEVCEICGFSTEPKEDFFFVWLFSALFIGLCISAVVTVKIHRDIRRKKTFFCPYCFQMPRRNVHEVKFRCENVECKNVKDKKAEFSNPIDSKMKNYAIPKHANCPECKEKTSILICPDCNEILPESSITGRDIIISVVGSRDAGKSHFLGVIIREMQERVAGKLCSGSMTYFDDSTEERYKNDFKRGLYEDLTKLDQTKGFNVNKDVYKPMVFTLSVEKNDKIAKIKKRLAVKKNDRFGKIKKVSVKIINMIAESRIYTLLFFDAAGEDLDVFDNMKTLNKYICESDGIIFLLDPMQIRLVRNDKSLDEEVVLGSCSVAIEDAKRPDDTLARLSRLIRHYKKMDNEDEIAIPVAAVLSKFDAIFPILPEAYETIRKRSPHCDVRAFDMTDCDDVNQQIKYLFRNWGAESIIWQLENNYTNYCFFAASSLGLNNAPRKDGRFEYPNPHRIEDALLWILKENMVIKTKK